MSDQSEWSLRAEHAYRRIARHGVATVESHPAVDEITLNNGDVLRHWEGGYEHDCYWTVKRRAEVNASGEQV